MKHAVAIAIFATAFSTVNVAGAFCRKTSCNEKTDDCARDENGCPTAGVTIRWKELPLTYRFSARGSGLLVREEARAAVRAAFHRWSDAVCSDGRRTSLRFVEGEDVAEDKPLVPKSRGKEPFAVYFRDLGWPYDGVDETLAQTNHAFGSKSGLVEYADIEVNSGARRFSVDESGTGTDLQAVVTHEVGHYIGLSHSNANDSIMRSGYCEIDGERCEKGTVAARRLATDDIDAVCILFPPDGPAATPSTTANTDDAAGCSTTAGRASTDGATLIAAGFGCAVIALRRRSASCTREAKPSRGARARRRVSG